MSDLLYIQASPRGGRSRSGTVADAFLDAWVSKHPRAGVDRLNVFTEDLPSFDGHAVEAKYEVLHGKSPSQAHREAWARVEGMIERFAAAQRYLLAVPMWNFGIPYRLKQYFDILVQPGYTFRVNEAGQYEGLLTGRRAVVAYARGGEYEGEAAAGYDFQARYVELILGFMGITQVQSVIVQPTLMLGRDVADQRTAEAVENARKMAENA